MRARFMFTGLLLLAGGLPIAHADNWLGADQGKLLLTAGFSTLEGAGGGALTPWAVIAGYGSNRSWGANAYASDVVLTDVELRAVGAAVGMFDRVELSFGRQQLEVTDGVLEGLGVTLEIVGVKIRLLGDAVYGQDSWVPQVAVGSQYKRHGGIDDFALTDVKQLGAVDTRGIDYFVSATKLSLTRNFLFNITLRATDGNQFGLLGFGGDRGGVANSGRTLQFETTAAYLLTRRVAVGGEYRTRPRNLLADDEGAAWDAFIAWAPNKHFSIVGAYANIGSLLTPVTTKSYSQDGGYVSVQVGF